MIEQIEILRNSTASGKDVFIGEVYAVPDEISLKDAQLLIALKKAKEIADINALAILHAIESMDLNDDSLWQADNKPKLKVLSQLLGKKITARQRDEALALLDEQTD